MMTLEILIYELLHMLENDVLRGERINDWDDDNARNDDIGQQHQSKHPLSSFTCEDDFTYYIHKTKTIL